MTAQDLSSGDDAEELTLPGAGELPRDPETRQAHVTLALYRLSTSTGCPEGIEQAYSLGYRAAESAERDRLRRDELFRRWLDAHTLDDVELSDAAVLSAIRPLLDACDAIPDFVLSRWAATPGHHWEPVRAALKAYRKGCGFDVEADLDHYDAAGWLLVRRHEKEDQTP